MVVSGVMTERTKISKALVEDIMHATTQVLYTGKYGDGKIFVYYVTNVIQVRTGEEDFTALQYPEIDK